MSTIDVLLPAYNAATTVEESVRSLLVQTEGDIRVIVVDDGSTDATPDILRRLAAEDERVVVARQENGGLVSALNYGLSLATAPLLARLDSDDIAHPTRLATQRAYLDEHKDCVAVGCGVRHIDVHGALTGGETHFPPPSVADPWWAPSKEPYIIHPFLMTRREALVSIGGYRSVHYSEDADLYWRLHDLGPMVNLPVVLGDYRIHAGAMSGSISNGRIMAIGSQLAAVSERRRRAGVKDIDFDALPLAAYRKAGSMQELYEIAAADLTEDEARWLRVALSVKLLELSGYRPFEIEHEDARFIGGGWPLRTVLAADNQREVWGFYARALVRLTRKGLFAEARAISQPELIVPAGLRAIKAMLQRK